jgi:hypothetical protein
MCSQQPRRHRLLGCAARPYCQWAWMSHRLQLVSLPIYAESLVPAEGIEPTA